MKIRLLILIFVSILIFPSGVEPGRLHFGIISAVKKKVDELGEKNPYSKLPDISTFITNKSDRFIVDFEDMSGGQPFMGVRSKHPHAGAHVGFNNTNNRWPKGGVDIPENYPPIYAAVDGVVMHVEYSLRVVTPEVDTDRYGVDVAFARDRNGSIYYLHYAIEPMVREPSVDFYKRFIRVHKGQEVKKGDVIAYMYTPPRRGGDMHIHFHIQRENDFMAPAIFTDEVVQKFYEKWKNLRDDGDSIPPCMGYKLGAHENPFGTGAVDILK